jgi:hypothetical protein
VLGQAFCTTGLHAALSSAAAFAGSCERPEGSHALDAAFCRKWSQSMDLHASQERLVGIAAMACLARPR